MVQGAVVSAPCFRPAGRGVTGPAAAVLGHAAPGALYCLPVAAPRSTARGVPAALLGDVVDSSDHSAS